MKIIFALVILLVCSNVFGQKIKFKIKNQKDTTVYLVKYYGKGTYYADSAELKNGIVEFDGSLQKPGLLVLLLPQQKYFEFIYNSEEIDIEASTPDFIKSMIVKKSEENKVFIPYMQFLAKKRDAANKIIETRSKYNEKDELYKECNRQLDVISEEVNTYQQSIINSNKEKFVSNFVKMGIDIQIPNAPKDETGNQIDPDFAYHYFRDHFFDNIDLKDDRLISTPVFHQKLEKYFGNTMMYQHWDSIIKYAFKFCDQLDPRSKMFEYCVSWITSSYEKSNVMGMDKVFVRMAQRYYCSKNSEGKSPAFWMDEEKLKGLIDRVDEMKYTLIGDVPPNLCLRDTSDTKWMDFYSLKSDYTIIYIWDPQCGHCKQITPKIQELYAKKMKARNVEVFAVGKAIGEDFEKWKKFIRDNNLTFINVALTEKLYMAALENAGIFVPEYTNIESLNYQKYYDIHSYPKIFVVDKNKVLIAKHLSVSQLEDFLDNLQNKKDSPKLFAPNLEEDEMMQH